jgi:cold shock CspA family protein
MSTRVRPQRDQPRGYKSLAEEAKVEYEVEDGPKGPHARTVSVIVSA